jgi:hypothetical protein
MIGRKVAWSSDHYESSLFTALYWSFMYVPVLPLYAVVHKRSIKTGWDIAWTLCMEYPLLLHGSGVVPFATSTKDNISWSLYFTYHILPISIFCFSSLQSSCHPSSSQHPRFNTYTATSWCLNVAILRSIPSRMRLGYRCKQSLIMRAFGFVWMKSKKN